MVRREGLEPSMGLNRELKRLDLSPLREPTRKKLSIFFAFTVLPLHYSPIKYKLGGEVGIEPTLASVYDDCVLFLLYILKVVP